MPKGTAARYVRGIVTVIDASLEKIARSIALDGVSDYLEKRPRYSAAISRALNGF